MNNNSNGFWAFAFGVVVGGSAVYYLNTKEGKKVAKKAKKQLKKLEKQTRQSLKAQAENFADKATKVVDKTKEWKEEATTKVKTKTDAVTHKAEELVAGTTSSFEKGVDKAKELIKAKTAIAD